MNYTIAPRMRGRHRTTHYGRIVTLEGSRLITKSLVSGVRRYTLAYGVKVTRRGRPCLLAELKSGDRVRVTVKTESDAMAIAIACLPAE
jgi:hypothetical protein